MSIDNARISTHLEQITSLTNHVLQRRARAVEARPVRLRFETVGQEVVGFDRPSAVHVVQGFEETTWRRIEQIESTSIRLAFVGVPLGLR